MSEVDKFVKWMQDSGFNLNSNVKVHKYEDGRGISLVAKTKLPENTLLFVIPTGFELSAETSSLPESIKQSEKFEQMTPWSKLILALIWEWKNPKSKWRPYLDVLPQRLDTPLFWSEAERKFLKGTDVEAHLGIEENEREFKTHLEPLIKEHSKLFESSDKQKENYFDLYNRFGSIIGAYSFTGDDESIAMMPVADMLNHKTGCNNARLFDDEDEEEEEEEDEEKEKEHKPLEMRTIVDVEAGSDLYNTYGELSNGELLRKYGFVEELSDNNPNNNVQISLKLTLEICKKNLPAAVFDERVKFMKEHELVQADTDDYFDLAKDLQIPQELDLVLRIFYMNTKEWEQWLESYKNQEEMDCIDDGEDCCHTGECEHKKDLIMIDDEEEKEEKKEDKEEKEEKEDKEEQEEKEEEGEGSDGDIEIDDIDEEKLRSLLAGEMDEDDMDDGLDFEIENFADMKKTLLQILQHRLSLYPTTIEDDLKLLGEEGRLKQSTEVEQDDKGGKGKKKKRKAEGDLNPRPLQKQRTSSSSSLTSSQPKITEKEKMALIVSVSEKEILKRYLEEIAKPEPEDDQEDEVEEKVEPKAEKTKKQKKEKPQEKKEEKKEKGGKKKKAK